MYHDPNFFRYQYQNPYYVQAPMYHYAQQPFYRYTTTNPCDYDGFIQGDRRIQLKDNGPNPYVVNINEATLQNNTYRTALWTGTHLQLTLMSLNPGEDIGLEMHPDVDQFLRIEQGQGIVQMGKIIDNFTFEKDVYDDYAIIIPAGTWHNLTNTGTTPLKLYSIYAPPNHPFGTVHTTKADAMAAEEEQGGTVISGKTPVEWVNYTEFLVNEGLEDVKRGINATHIL